MTDLLRQDPWLAHQASRDDRLYLKRSVGPYSGGTQVTLLRADNEYTVCYVKPTTVPNGEVIECTIDDLVIRRKHSG